MLTVAKRTVKLMKAFSGIAKGIVALLFVATILLLSDMENRTGIKNSRRESSSKKVFKISVIHYVDSPNSEECERGLRDYLKDIGWVDGKDFTVAVFNAQGDMSALNSIAGNVTAQDWDMIVANSTPTIQALAKRKTRSPIVFTNVGDPIIAGLGKSFTDHVAGITGVSTMSDFDGMIDLVVTLQPGIKSIGTVFAPAEINSVAYKEALEKSAKKRGLVLVSAPASNTSEINDAAMSITTRGIGAVCQISDNLTASCITSIIKAAESARLPLYGFVTKLMTQGAIAVVARDYHQAGYDAGAMVKKVLDGTPPKDIPFQLVTKTNYMLSPSVAGNYKIEVPDGLSKNITLTK